MDWLKEQYGNVEGPLGFPMKDREARTLETILKSLPRNKDFEYRKVVSQKGVSEILPGERSDVSWISTESVDRAGEVVLARGMNDSQFQANPVVTLGHAYHIPPAGKSLWRKHSKDGELRGVKAKTIYPAMPEGWKEQWMQDKVFPLVQAELLNGRRQKGAGVKSTYERSELLPTFFFSGPPLHSIHNRIANGGLDSWHPSEMTSRTCRTTRLRNSCFVAKRRRCARLRNCTSTPVCPRSFGCYRVGFRRMNSVVTPSCGCSARTAAGDGRRPWSEPRRTARRHRSCA